MKDLLDLFNISIFFLYVCKCNVIILVKDIFFYLYYILRKIIRAL